MHWRTKFLLQAAQVLVLPPVALHASFVAFGYHPGALLRSLLFAVSIVAYIRLSSWYRFYTIDRKAAALGARTIPIVKGKWPGNLDLLIRLMQTPKEAYVGARLYEFFKQYKTNTINIRPLGMDLIMTCDHGIIKEMLATGFARWEKGPRQREKLADFFGRGIFAVDGEEWKRHRSMTRPYLSKERTSDFDTFWKYAQVTISILDNISRKDVPVLDIQDLLARFTMDSASEFLFGKCLDTLKGRMPVAGQAKLGTRGSAHANATEDSFGDFATAFEKAQMVLSNRAVRGKLWPLFELFENKCAPYMLTINSFLDPVIARAQKRQAGNISESESNDGDVEVDPTGEESTTLLGELVTSINDPIVVRNELLNILLAGRDTTAALLTFVIYMLSQHPDVEEKLRDEINKTWIDQDEQPTYETVKKMKYLRAVLDETLRLFPPVPLNHRTSSVDCTLPPTDCKEDPDKRPYFVPADTQITYSPIIMQRSEALWGPDAQEWKPERWLDPKEAAKHNASFEFVPFNAGPRICLGLNLAYNEVSFFLTVILPKFRLHLAPKYQPEGSAPRPEWKKDDDTQMGRVRIEKIWPLSSVTMYVKGGLWMQVERLYE